MRHPPCRAAARLRHINYSFLSGPQVTHHTGKVELFLHQLVGLSRDSMNPGTQAVIQSGFTIAAGGGLDYVITKRWAIRVFQADYVRGPPRARTISSHKTNSDSQPESAGDGRLPIAEPDRQSFSQTLGEHLHDHEPVGFPSTRQSTDPFGEPWSKIPGCWLK